MSRQAFLTEDVRNLMQRISDTILSPSSPLPAPVSPPSSDNSSTITFEPDSPSFSSTHHCGFSRTPVPQCLYDSFRRSASPTADSAAMQRTISCERFKNTTLRRMEAIAKRSEAAKQQLKQKEEQQFLEDTKQFKASEHSKQLVGRSEPLQTRTAKILQERASRTKDLQTKLAQASEVSLQSDLTFTPRIQPHPRAKMTPSDFYDYNLKWASSAKKTAVSHLEHRERVQKEALTLRPSLNTRSRKLAVRGGRPETRVSEFLRKKERKIEDMRKTLEPSFKPDMSATSKRLVKRVTSRPMADRTDVSPRAGKQQCPVLFLVDSMEDSQESPETPRLSASHSPSFHS